MGSLSTHRLWEKSKVRKKQRRHSMHEKLLANSRTVIAVHPPLPTKGKQANETSHHLCEINVVTLMTALLLPLHLLQREHKSKPLSSLPQHFSKHYRGTKYSKADQRKRKPLNLKQKTKPGQGNRIPLTGNEA
jgi:hypothetical protein